jgi:cytidyltransferase-like protein
MARHTRDRPCGRCLVDGVFDLFHVGHLSLIERASRDFAQCWVGLDADEFVEQYKGRRPVVPFAHRRRILEAVRYVDGIVTMTGLDCYTVAFLDAHGVDYLVHGATEDPALLRIFAELIDAGRYYELEETPSIRTTTLIEICKSR